MPDMSADIDLQIRQQEVLQLVLAVAGGAESIALRLTVPVRILALAALAAAAWLAYWSATLIELGAFWFVLFLLPLCLPAGALGLSYWLLRRAVGLPRQIIELAETAYGMGHMAVTDAVAGYTAVRSGQGRVKPRELWRLGRALRQLRKVPGEASKLLGATGRAVAIANPLFMIGTAVSSVLALLLVGSAGVTLIIRLL